MRTLDINLQIEAMKHETKAQPISNLRTSIRYASPDAKLDDAKKLAKVIPAAAFRKTANGIQMTAYNGIIQIEVNHLANLMEVNRVKQEAEELSQTYLAFMGSSGHSVKIWVRFTRPDKSLPKNREEAEIFQAHAYRKAVSLYQPILSYSIELKNPALEQFCRQTYDPELYYNPDSTIMYMRQPMEMPSETTYQEAVQAETSPFKRLIPGYDSLETLSALFEVALNKACQSLSELQPGIYPRSDEDLKPLLVQLAENCFQAGIPEEETARWAIAHLYRQKKEFLIRQTVQSVYTIAKGFGKKSPLSAEQELELARFKLQAGARLRSDYVDFYDYETEFDTVNRIYVPYAAPDHPGIWPQILKSFARELLKYAVTDPWDCAFCLQCLQRKEAMPYEAVRAYLHARLGQNKEYTNMQMYGALKKILREAGGREEIPGQTRKKEGTLLML